MRVRKTMNSHFTKERKNHIRVKQDRDYESMEREKKHQAYKAVLERKSTIEIERMKQQRA
jgi:hypothetical protein